MAGVDSLSSSQSLFFQASAMAATQQAKQNSLQKKEKVSAKKSTFRSAMQKAQDEADLVAEGLPPEIAGMETEEAVVFLKDAVDIAGDELKAQRNMAAMEKYRRKMSQFLKFLSKNNYEVHTRKINGVNKRGKKLPPQETVKIINQKLDQLVQDMLYNHATELRILSKVDELKGMIVDLLE